METMKSGATNRLVSPVSAPAGMEAGAAEKETALTSPALMSCRGQGVGCSR